MDEDRHGIANGSITAIVERARSLGAVVPGFNIPYLPMMAPVVAALRDADAFALIMVARLEWTKFASGSPQAVAEEYTRVADHRHTRLHLDHVPVIDEDNQRVPFIDEIQAAIDCGYDSVMVDGSRLPLEENIASTRAIVERAHAVGVAVEAELGAVLGHEAGPLPPYEELFTSGRGFTDPDEARRFVAESGCDWLSVAIGSVHGAISAATRHQAKIAARLDIAQLDRLRAAVSVPLVLHGGTGIPRALIAEAIGHGIAKINIATAIRQPYEKVLAERGEAAAVEAVYEETRRIIEEELALGGLATRLAVPPTIA